MKTRSIYVTAWGDIALPEDFPTHVFRKDGWWDGRYRGEVVASAKLFITIQTQILMDAYLALPAH